MDDKVAWFDNLDKKTFCNELIKYMIYELGYTEGLHLVYWCAPGSSIDQLVEINFVRDVQKMAEASVESKVLVIFLNHDRARARIDSDDVSGCPKQELPEVLLAEPPGSAQQELPEVLLPSPPGSPRQELDDSENSEQEGGSDCDSVGDPSWFDSDYDFSKDDELYENNVDESEEDELVKQGKQSGSHDAYVPGYDAVTQDELKLPEEDDSEKRYKSDSDDEEHKKKKNQKNNIPYTYTPFNTTSDMENP